MKRKIIACFCCLLCLASFLYAEEETFIDVSGKVAAAQAKTEEAARLSKEGDDISREALETYEEAVETIEQDYQDALAAIDTTFNGQLEELERSKEGKTDEEIKSIDASISSTNYGKGMAKRGAGETRTRHLNEALSKYQNTIRNEANPKYEAASRARDEADAILKSILPTTPTGKPVLPNGTTPVITPFDPVALAELGLNEDDIKTINTAIFNLGNVSSKLENSILISNTTQNMINTALSLHDPILSTSGRYLFTETDFSITMYGETFDFGRYYNSGKDISDIMGKDWFFTIDTRVKNQSFPIMSEMSLPLL